VVASDSAHQHLGGTTISVRHLAHFLFRQGGLGSDARGFAGIQRAHAGSRVHRKLQSQRGENYQSEVALTHSCDIEGITYTLQGRADGIERPYKDGVLIEEIKTVHRLTPHLPDSLDLAQAKLYGAMFATQIPCSEESDSVSPSEDAPPQPVVWVKMTYFQLKDGETSVSYFSFKHEELIQFLETSLTDYHHWIKGRLEHRIARNMSFKDLSFPYPFRRGQREYAATCYRTIRDKSGAFIMAPTGLGKTLGTLFSSLKALGSHADRIAYVTAKNTGKQEVERAAQILQGVGAKFRLLTLTAKETVCLEPDLFCQPKICPLATTFFDHLHQAMESALCLDRITPKELADLARTFNVCPYYLSLELVPWVDLIVGDYNYAFDPNVRAASLLEDSEQHTILLVDEAHNLPDRGRAMHSGALKKSQVLQFMKELSDLPKGVKKALNRLNRLLLATRRDMEHNDQSHRVNHLPPEELNKAVSSLTREFSHLLTSESAQSPTDPIQESLLEAFFLFNRLQTLLDQWDEAYRSLLERTGKELTWTLLCIHPGSRLNKCAQQATGHIYFSATLHPLSFFKSQLGSQEEHKAVAFPSPFPRENLLLLVGRNVNTRFSKRDASMSELVASLRAAVEPRIGNYLFFFPSFEYLEGAWKRWIEEVPDSTCTSIRQQRNLSDSDRVTFLERFDESPQQSLVGFVVLGGIFSEGVDLAGTKLDGAIIVGVGLPPRSLTSDLIQDDVNQRGEDGYAYAYRLPGWVRIQQAAGRVIRSEKDRGFVILLGDRFASDDYRPLFPDHWLPPVQVDSAEEIRKEVSFFWS